MEPALHVSIDSVPLSIGQERGVMTSERIAQGSSKTNQPAQGGLDLVGLWKPLVQTERSGAYSLSEQLERLLGLLVGQLEHTCSSLSKHLCSGQTTGLKGEVRITNDGVGCAEVLE